MSRVIVFDTGPLISLVMNNLLHVLEPLKKMFNGDFVITPAVRGELIDRPLEGKRFAFEALRVLRHVRDGTITIMDSTNLKNETNKLMILANQSFKAKGQWIKIVHYGEMEAVALAIREKAEAFVVDERTTRMLIENPESVEVRLKKKLHTEITVNHHNLDDFKKLTKDIRILRSIEFMAAAYERGLLSRYLPDQAEHGSPEEKLIDSVLWGLKFSGCAISNEELSRVKGLVRAPPKQHL